MGLAPGLEEIEKMVQSVKGGGLNMISTMARHQREVAASGQATDNTASNTSQVAGSASPQGDTARHSVNLQGHPVGRVINTAV